MGFERVHLFRRIEVNCYSVSTAALYLYTDLPGGAMTLRVTKPLPAQTSQAPIRSALPSDLKGKLIRVKIVPAGNMYLYGIRVEARELPGGDWQWYPLYVPPTSPEWTPIEVPMPITPAEQSAISVPIPITPEAFSPVAVPLPPTPVEFSPVRVPLPATQEIAEWLRVPVDE